MSLFLQDYIKLRRIGEGAFASIWKVQHKTLGYVRAIKVLNAMLEDENDATYQTFLKECRVLLQIGNGCHPNIVRVYQPRLVDNRALVEMDYVDGCTMTEVLKERPFQEMDEVYRFIREIGSALAYCHVDIYRFMMNPAEDRLERDPHNARKFLISPAKERELIRKYSITHNDLHSNNVMRRDYDGSYVLLDFGLAIQDKKCVKSSSQRDGAPEYKAPEKWESSELTPRTDVYSLGVMMYEMLAGTPPFVCDMKKYKSREEATYNVSRDHLETPPPAILPRRKAAFEKMHPHQTYEQDYPDWLEQIIMKCLAKKPEDRYSDAKEMLEDFEAHIKDLKNPEGDGNQTQNVAVYEEKISQLDNNCQQLREQLKMTEAKLTQATFKNEQLEKEVGDLQQTINNLVTGTERNGSSVCDDGRFISSKESAKRYQGAMPANTDAIGTITIPPFNPPQRTAMQQFSARNVLSMILLLAAVALAGVGLFLMGTVGLILLLLAFGSLIAGIILLVSDHKTPPPSTPASVFE